MNAYDTEVVSSALKSRGAAETDDPGEADVIIVNTCSVREHAEERAVSRIINLSIDNPARLVVCGCMAQRLKSKLFDIIPGIDILAGANSYRALPEAIEDVLKSGGRYTLFGDEKISYSLSEPGYRKKPERYISITRGCNKFCSYCIVPYLRGRVRSKPPVRIIREIRGMVEGGAREVTLLGQNVMSYSYEDYGFAELLREVAEKTELERIRFLTTHPRDLSMKLFDLMLEYPAICPHIHLPVQSGSNRILDIMKRGYSREEYIDIVERARDRVSDLAFTTDIIVGYPTESEKDFQDTVDLAERIRFDAAFTFKYSPREGTRAAVLDDDVNREEKKRRLSLLNRKVCAIRREILEECVGSTEEILVDGRVKKGDNYYSKGRTRQFRNVMLEGSNTGEGELVTVKLRSLHNFTLIGEERS